MEIKKLSIIIPVYNEELTIHLILNKLKNLVLRNNIKKEIIIINDCSKDNTENSIYKYCAENPELNIEYFKALPPSEWTKLPKEFTSN